MVRDSQNDAAALLAHLAGGGYPSDCRRVDNEPDFEKALAEGSWDLVVADYLMPGFSGHQALRLLKKNGSKIPFLFLSGTLGDSDAAAAIEAGACDFIPKGNLDRLVPAIQRALGRPPPSANATGRDGTAREGVQGSAAIPGPSPPALPVVLLVDDRMDNLLALEAALGDLGANLLSATSGDEALALLLKVEPVCILLDVRMPDLDGLATARIIKGRPKLRHVPILFLTASFDSTEEIGRIYQTGASDYIPKPFIPELLRAKVRVFLDLWSRNEDLRLQMARVEALNRELRQFTEAVSHDLRAPLRAIARCSRTILEDHAPTLDKDVRLFALRIDESATRMNAFVTELLDYAQLDQENLPLRVLGTEETVREVLSELGEAIESCEGTVALQGPFFAVLAHPTAFRQAIRNLVSNALKFVAPQAKPVVMLRSERRGGRVRLWVEDQGIGIDPDQQPKVFEPFVRLVGQKEYPGSGLGLAIVRRAADRMGGTCGCESRPGKGSRFWLDLLQA